MITHKIEKESAPVLYQETVDLDREEVQRVRLLLSLDKLELMNNEKKERLFIKTDSQEVIYDVKFVDGCYVKWCLVCGTDNYYDEVTFRWPGGDSIILDCTYTLDDMAIEVNDKTYIVHLLY